VRVLSDVEIGQDAHVAAERGELVEAGERDGGLIADTVAVHDDMRR
jgi:hypothetical protein